MFETIKWRNDFCTKTHFVLIFHILILKRTTHFKHYILPMTKIKMIKKVIFKCSTLILVGVFFNCVAFWHKTLTKIVIDYKPELFFFLSNVMSDLCPWFPIVNELNLLLTHCELSWIKDLKQKLRWNRNWELDMDTVLNRKFEKLTNEVNCFFFCFFFCIIF